MPDAASSNHARALARGWTAIGLVLSAAGWAADGVWVWILVLVGFACVAWGAFRLTRARRTGVPFS